MTEYSVQFASSADEVPAGLWELFAPPLEGRWWYETLEQSGLEDQFVFLYATVFENERPVGLAPVFAMDVPIELVLPPGLLPVFNFAAKAFPFIKYQRTLFAGSPCSDEGAVGVVPGACRRAIFRALHPKGATA